MKKLLTLIALITFVLGGCSTQKPATAVYDDVYNSTPSNNVKETPKLSNEDLSTSNSISERPSWYSEYENSAAKANTDTTIKKSYYDEYSQGQGEGNDADVNLYIGSSWSPYFWGPAISFGYSWGYPYYDYGWYSWGYPYYGYPYWYYPYYSYGYYGWGGYWNGYYDGYWHGYYDGSWGYYPYSVSYYYGPRKMLASSGNYYDERNSRGGGSYKTTGEPSNREVSPARESRTTGMNERTARTGNEINTRSTTGNTNSLTTPGVNQRTTRENTGGENTRYRYDRSKTAPVTNSRYSNNESARTGTGKVQPGYQARYTRQDHKPLPKYTRPGQARQESSNNVRTETRNYSSPAYRQPKSSQEYINPSNNAGRSSTISTEQRNNNAPSGTKRSTNYNKSYDSRNYSSPNVRGYSPSGSERNSTPSHSSPSRSSSPSYSSPSRSSSPSYSSPGGRSGGSSGGSSGGRSGGSSGGGGGRR